MVKHNPPNAYGDCIAACIRTLTDDDKVPHLFGLTPPEQAWEQIRDYLKTKGKNIALFPVENPLEYMGLNNPGVPYMLLCGTKNGNHAVVCLNDQVVHDPAWYKTEITGPMENGLLIVGVIL